MLTSDEGEPGNLGSGRRRLVKGRFGDDRFGVTLAGEAIVEFDDLGCGQNNEPDLLGLWSCAELQALTAVTTACTDYGRTILTSAPNRAIEGT